MSYIVTAPPHLKAEQSVPDVMRTVCIALVPAYLWALYNFGWYAWVVTAVCVGACVLTEAACQKLRGVPMTVNDWSAAVTGLLLAAVLPPNVSWYVAAVGGAFAIGVAKHAFGGLGNNIWNPALLARAFLQVAYASQVSAGRWPRTGAGTLLGNLGTSLRGSFDALAARADVVSAATPLARLAPSTITDADLLHSHAPAFRRLTEDGGHAAYAIFSEWSWVGDAFLGRVGGCIGEVSAFALLLGACYMIYKKVITWEIPVAYVTTAVLLTWILPAPLKVAGEGVVYTEWFTGPWAIHLMGGGLILGAFYMATDMVTTPMSSRGRLVFGLGCGLLTVTIRLYSGAYPEGVCYSILIMNTCVPLIDAWTRPRVFGTGRAGCAGSH